jgi:hypothetical protein
MRLRAVPDPSLNLELEGGTACSPRRISGGTRSLPPRNLTTPPLCTSLLRGCQCTGKRSFWSAGLYMVPWISPNMTVHNICRVDRCRQRSARQRGVSSESTPYSAAPLDVRVASDSLLSFRSSTGASLPFPARQPPRGGNRRPQVLVRADCSRPVRRRFGNSPCFKSDRVLVPSH